jgi:UDPglucose 6-dehydrogenase
MICVNTPMKQETGECFVGIVEKVIEDCRTLLPPSTIIVVRSTVPVGFSAAHNTVAFCEYLTEANWKQDVLQTKEWIVGVDEGVDKQQIISKFEQMFNNVFPNSKRSYISSSECEAIKYMRNCFLATKVSFCNEMEAFCTAKHVDYGVVREYATHDARVGTSHTLVPGPDGKRGFSLSCFPKDTASLIYQMKDADVQPVILQAVVHRNNTIDRPDHARSLSARQIGGQTGAFSAVSIDYVTRS